MYLGLYMLQKELNRWAQQQSSHKQAMQQGEPFKWVQGMGDVFLDVCGVDRDAQTMERVFLRVYTHTGAHAGTHKHTKQWNYISGNTKFANTIH